MLLLGRALASGLVLLALLGRRDDPQVTVDAPPPRAADGGLTLSLEDAPFDEERPLILPRSAWRSADGPLRIAGRTFALEASAFGECLGVDTDADGCIDATVECGSGAVALEVDGSPYWVRFHRCGRHWRWAPAGGRSTRYGETTVRLVDLNANGFYGDIGVDGWITGDARVPCPVSRVVSLEGELFGWSLDADERHVELTPYTGPRGGLDVTSAYTSAGRLACAIFEADSGLSFDLARAHGEIPAGDYRFVVGAVVGDGESARIEPGRMEPVRVTAGETRVLAWGGPLAPDFQVRRCGTKLTVLPDVVFQGSAGESYSAFSPVAEAPLIEVRQVGTGALLQYGRFGGCCGGGLSACVLDVPADAAVEVHLVHERALFGPIVGVRR